jgi:hypothetical protein
MDHDEPRDTAPPRTHSPASARRCLDLQAQLADLYRLRWTRREVMPRSR